MTADAGRIAERLIGHEGVTGIRRFGTGHINETFLVTTRHDEYVLQQLNRAVFTDPARVIANILTVTAHLDGRFVPELVAFEEDWRMWRRVEHAAPTNDVTPERAAGAAQFLGEFHTALATLDPRRVTETLPNFHDPQRRLAVLRAIVADDPYGRAGGASREVDAVLARSSIAQEAVDTLARVPIRVAHNDAKIDNVLFRGDTAVCIVDLDTLMPTAWVWDVGDLLRSAATTAAEDDPSAVVDAELYCAILDGYRRGAAEQTAAEVDALEVAGALVTYEQAVRFLTDWIGGDVYYRTSRPGQNLERARAQLGLLATMPGTVGS